MSCNGCKILRKGCSENCILRQSLQGIEGPQAQANATAFVAKFFGRACLMSFLSSIPEPHRPALFQSLLYEACGRTVNPVMGSVGLLWAGNWSVCQNSVETVLSGGVLKPLPETSYGFEGESSDLYRTRDLNGNADDTSNLDLRLTAGSAGRALVKSRQESTDESETTTLDSNRQESEHTCSDGHETKLLKLFF